MFKKLKKAIRETLSENGVMSWARVASSVLLIYGIHWVNKIVSATHALPDLIGLAALIVSPYGLARAATAAQSFSKNPAILTQTGDSPAAPSQIPVSPVVVPPAPVVVVGPTSQPVQGPSGD